MRSIKRNKLEYDTIDNFLPDRVNKQDPRYLEAVKFYSETSNGTHVVKLHKTTRAGATVALSAESINRKELATLICRTNRVITHTVKGDVVGHTQKYHANPVHITRNSYCPKITSLIRKHPSVQLLGILPLPNCDRCKIPTKECPIKYAFDTPPENIDIYCLTYAKLASLMLSESDKVTELLNKVLTSRNFILDEVQHLQEGEAINTAIWTKGADREFNLIENFENRFCKLSEVSPIMKQFISDANGFLKQLQPITEQLKARSQQDRYRKHLSFSDVNPSVKKELEMLKELTNKTTSGVEKSDVNKNWLKNAIETSQQSLRLESEKPQEAQVEFHIDHTTPFGSIMTIQKKLVNIMIRKEKYSLNEEEIIALSKLLFITTAKRFTVSYVKSLRAETITLQAENSVFYRALQKFLERILASRQPKRVIFTTATFGGIRLESLFNRALKNIPIESKTWGRNGDPMNTRDKALIITDKFRISPYNFGRKFNIITKLIKSVAKRYGLKNIQVCTMNKRWAARLLKDLKTSGFTEDDITWYGSDRTEGVASKKRIWITVGLAEKPINAKDSLAEVQARFHENPLKLDGEELLHFISQKLRRESVHISTYQAFSRAKDPQGKDRSLVIAIGTRKKEVEDCLLWGPDRRLVPEETDRGFKFDVVVDRPLGRPKTTVAPLTTDVEESLHIIDQWMSYDKIVEYKLNWIHLKRMVDKRGYVSAKRLIRVYGLKKNEVKEFLGNLPELFTNHGIADYALVRDSTGAIKAVATSEYYEKRGKSRILSTTRFTLIPIVQAHWFLSLKGAVDRASEDTQILCPSYFNHHVSSNIYDHLSEFFDVLSKTPSLCPGWLVVGEKGAQRESRKLIRDIHCLGAWSPTFPRRFGVPHQFNVGNITSLLKAVRTSIKSGSGAYTSVYSFPDSVHPSEGGNPPIDTIFIDIDLESPAFSDLMTRFQKGEDVLSGLLELRHKLLGDIIGYAKALVLVLVQLGIVPRIILSGFKGLHVFIDLVPVQFGSPEIAKHVSTLFTQKLAQDLNIRVDTSVCGDLSRLCRIPNTLNVKASKVLARPQYAVPIIADELRTLTPETYDQLCSEQKFVAVSRVESMDVSRELIKLAQDADPDEISLNIGRGHVRDPAKVAEYETECIREILTDEEFAELPIRPCFKHIRENSIPLDGSQGHMMRIAAAMELATEGLSMDSIVRWFDFTPDFDPDITRRKVEELISYGYMDRKLDNFGGFKRRGFRCSTIQAKCPDYCLKHECPIYRKKFDRG